MMNFSLKYWYIFKQKGDEKKESTMANCLIEYLIFITQIIRNVWQAGLRIGSLILGLLTFTLKLFRTRSDHHAEMFIDETTSNP